LAEGARFLETLAALVEDRLQGLVRYYVDDRRCSFRRVDSRG
jgi:hypothetical protein